MRRKTDRQPGASSAIAVGDYLCSKTKLVYVESIADDRAVVEDCATGDMITVPIHALLTMRQVSPTRATGIR
jgi:hypothetical protein